MSVGNQKSGRHAREPWHDGDCSAVYVHATLGRMHGTYKRSEAEAEPFLDRYARAKAQFDMSAATDIVEECANERVVDRLVDHLLDVRMPPRLVMPFPQFDRPSFGNALPPALAARLAAELGCEVDEEIIETARPGRGPLKKFPRFLWQPCFAGAVRSDCAYILVDDVCTNGGTLAALRSFIVKSGGTVIAATVLAHRDGKDQSLCAGSEAIRVLEDTFGAAPLNQLWNQEVGHDIKCLTEGEATGLIEWAEASLDDDRGDAAIQRLRNRLAEAAAKAS